MRGKKTAIAIFILSVLSFVGMIGCSQKQINNPTADEVATDREVTTNLFENSEWPESWKGLDLSEEVHLVGYLIGERPEGMDQVMEKLNAKLKEDINVTLEVRHLSWGDYVAKYPLILASGEEVDFIFTADWCMYAQEATKHAFKLLTMEDIAAYMPRHYENCDPDAYKQAEIDGNLYMLPTSSPDVRCICLIYRRDIAEKYRIEGLNKLSDFTDYFKVIAEQEPEIQPMSLSLAYDAPWLMMANEYSKEIHINNALCYYLEDDKIQLAPLYEEPYRSSLMYSFRIMKEWYDLGYINKDILSNDIISQEAFLQGRSAIAIANSVDVQSTIAIAEDKGYEVGIIPLVDSYGKTTEISYLNNGVAISAASKYPERTMMMLDLIMEEKEYNYLVYFGLEGINYTINNDGKIDLPAGITSESNTYPVDLAGFWFTNKNQHAPLAYWSEDYITLREKIPSIVYYNPYLTFAPDISGIQNEVSDITLVMQQYAQPLYAGMVEDVEESMRLLEEKLMEAGIDRVQKEIQRQTDEFLKEK